MATAKKDGYSSKYERLEKLVLPRFADGCTVDDVLSGPERIEFLYDLQWTVEKLRRNLNRLQRVANLTAAAGTKEKREKLDAEIIQGDEELKAVKLRNDEIRQKMDEEEKQLAEPLERKKRMAAEAGNAVNGLRSLLPDHKNDELAYARKYRNESSRRSLMELEGEIRHLRFMADGVGAPGSSGDKQKELAWIDALRRHDRDLVRPSSNGNGWQVTSKWESHTKPKILKHIEELEAELPALQKLVEEETQQMERVRDYYVR